MRFTSKALRITVCALMLASAGLAIAKPSPYRRILDFKCEAPLPVCPCPMLMDGFYVGAAVGYDIITGNNNLSTAGLISVSGNPHLAAKNWDGGLFVGVGNYYKKAYIGAEIFGNYTGARHTLKVTGPDGSVSLNLRSNGDIGIALLPGLALNNATLGYIRLGYVWANVSTNTTVRVFAPPATFSGGHNATRSGVIYGIGLETLLKCNFSVRGEYDYIYLNHTTASNNTFSSRVNPSDNRFSIGLVYHVC